MAMKNKYAKRARISEAKIREIVRYVAADLTALQAAALSGLNRNTVNRLYRGVRERMLLACEAQRRLFGVVEVDESFFGARRVKGRRGRGAYGKTVVFGIFERQGHVYTEIVPAHPAHPRPGRPAHRPTLQGTSASCPPQRPSISTVDWPSADPPHLQLRYNHRRAGCLRGYHGAESANLTRADRARLDGDIVSRVDHAVARRVHPQNGDRPYQMGAPACERLDRCGRSGGGRVAQGHPADQVQRAR